MEHERPETTAIYLQVKGQEAHGMQMQYWNRANKNRNELTYYITYDVLIFLY